jgi:hypothetical protein
MPARVQEPPELHRKNLVSKNKQTNKQTKKPGDIAQ